MLNNIYCVSDEKDPQNRDYNFYFSCTLVLDRRGKKRKFKANAALTIDQRYPQIFCRLYITFCSDVFVDVAEKPSYIHVDKHIKIFQ